MRKNPFPGLNPWMQDVWHDVRAKLIIYLSEAITDKLPDDLVARAEESVTLSGPTEDLNIARPDVNVSEADSWKDGVAPAWSPEVDESLSARIASPVIVALDEETHRWIEIRDTQGSLVTVIEILSPANKTPGGRKKFDAKLLEFWNQGVSTVEIDLVRGGVNAASARFGKNWPAEEHQVIVTRRGQTSHHEVYPCPLREPLPVFRIPLRSHEPDLPFDLQPPIDRCYEKGRYWLLNYGADPIPSLSEEDLKWAREVLREST